MRTNSIVLEKAHNMSQACALERACWSLWPQILCGSCAHAWSPYSSCRKLWALHLGTGEGRHFLLWSLCQTDPLPIGILQPTVTETVAVPSLLSFLHQVSASPKGQGKFIMYQGDIIRRTRRIPMTGGFYQNRTATGDI